MRHLLLTLVMALSNTAFAQQQEAQPASPSPAAVLSRGAIDCSTWKSNLKVEGRVFEDSATGIKFSYTEGVRFSVKFISKTVQPNGQIAIQGQLVTSNADGKAKSTFTMTEEIQGKEYYQMVKYSLVKPDGSTLEGSEPVRCTNFRNIAEILQ